MLALVAARQPATRLRTLVSAAWHRWFLDRHAEFWLGELGVRATSQISARVVEIIDETPDTRSFVLAPGRRWPGHRAGQFVPVVVEIDGVRTQRCYSISSGASDARARYITITVKRVPGGRMSNWLHDVLAPGDLVGLGTPGGDFVVDAPAPLLLVAGGSGITPIIAILRDLESRHTLNDVVLVHSVRRSGDPVFGRELAMMARQQSSLRLIAHYTPGGANNRLDPAALRALVPDAARREIYVCGPQGLLDVVVEVADGATVHQERFARPVSRTTAAPVTVQLRGRNLALAGKAPLLVELEDAGERPAHGCRMGICNSCRCHKRTGTVEDVVTGGVSSEPDQEIRLCVSIARSDLELAL